MTAIFSPTEVETSYMAAYFLTPFKFKSQLKYLYLIVMYSIAIIATAAVSW